MTHHRKDPSFDTPTPHVDTANPAHNVRPEQVSAALAYLQTHGNKAPSMRITGFGNDPGGIADGPNSPYGTDLCKPNADGTTNLQEIDRLFAQLARQNQALAVQIKGAEGNWLWVSDVVDKANAENPEDDPDNND